MSTPVDVTLSKVPVLEITEVVWVMLIPNPVVNPLTERLFAVPDVIELAEWTKAVPVVVPVVINTWPTVPVYAPVEAIFRIVPSVFAPPESETRIPLEVIFVPPPVTSNAVPEVNPVPEICTSPPAVVAELATTLIRALPAAAVYAPVVVILIPLPVVAAPIATSIIFPPDARVAPDPVARIREPVVRPVPDTCNSPVVVVAELATIFTSPEEPVVYTPVETTRRPIPAVAAPIAISTTLPVVKLAPPPVTRSPTPVVNPVPVIETMPVVVVALFALTKTTLFEPAYTPEVKIFNPVPAVAAPISKSSKIPVVRFAPPPVIEWRIPEVCPVALCTSIEPVVREFAVRAIIPAVSV